MNYQETVNWIFEKLPMYQRIGAAAYKANLDNTHLLMQMTGNPHEGLNCIHIAGTNGKGSVSHMLASILQESGLKTGLYTSPHMFDYRERMRINGKKIPKKFVTEFINKHKSSIESIEPSFFEISVALAFTWFKHENVDIAVIETGMGGRLDSTNVITPLLSVITNIGMDHTVFLGDTLEKIATEKAGIIKPQIPVVIGESSSETLPVFRNIAKKQNAHLKQADKYLFFHQNTARPACMCGNILRKGKIYVKNIRCPLKGRYQEKNLLTVVESVRLLKKQGFKIKKRIIKKGIANVIFNTQIIGRWETAGEKPAVICDVAHNNEGLQLIFQQILSQKHEKLHVVFGVNNDKSLDELFSILPAQAEYYFCKANVPRALDAETLGEYAKKHDLSFSVHKTVEQAFEAAQKSADAENDFIFCGGSTFVVAEIPPLIEKHNKDE